MAYQALRNFKIHKTTVKAGETYSGEDAELLLRLGLIVGAEEISVEEPSSPVESEVLPKPEVESESPKKGKKKKG